MKKQFLFPFLFIFVFFSTKVEATKRYVKSTGTGNGSTWSTASSDLQAMINASAIGDEIWVAEGIYKPTKDAFGNATPTNLRDRTFYLKNKVKMYGGFWGDETSLINRHGGASVLSGDFNDNDFVSGSGSTLTISNNTENAYHVVLSCGDDNTTILNGFSIIRGNADGIGTITIESQDVKRGYGGGISSSLTSTTVQNCIFKENATNNYGGGMYDIPTLSNCVFWNNFASLGGAGIYTRTGTNTIDNCAFVGNLTNSDGAGINIDYFSKLTITNCTFTGNKATNGGAIRNSMNNVFTINNCVFWGNVGVGNNASISGLNATSTLKYSIVEGGITACANCPNTNGNINPLFADFSDPDGADNIWLTADDGLNLQPTSPAINVGDPTISTPTIDIKGASRIGIFDIGAYEYVYGVGIAQSIEGKIQLSLFPNPATDNFQIQFLENGEANLNIDIYNILGMNVLQKNVLISNLSDLISLSELPKGLYIVQCTYNGQIIREKLVKE